MSGGNHADDGCAIVGVGATPFTRDSGVSVLSLATEASLAAIQDAGMVPNDIDGIVRCESDEAHVNDLADALGISELSFWGAVEGGGAAPCGMVGLACAAIASGRARSVLVYRALNGRSGFRFGQGQGDGSTGGNATYDEYFIPWGLTAFGQMFALMARRHMHEYGTTPEQLGSIALAVRRRANANPAAQMYGRPMTMDDYLASRVISDPLRLFDYCLESDGACAVVVTSKERAADCPQPPAAVLATAQSSIPGPQPGQSFTSLMRTNITTQPSSACANRLYKRAGIGADDIDVAQFYDCFTITVLLQLEDYGFCKKGEGGPFAASGALEINGSLPINTAGGHLSEAYIHGLNHVVEGVKQIRGQSTSQVHGAETCLVTSGIPNITSAMILQKV